VAVCKTVPYDWSARPYPVVSGDNDGLAAGHGCARVHARRSRKQQARVRIG